MWKRSVLFSVRTVASVLIVPVLLIVGATAGDAAERTAAPMPASVTTVLAQDESSTAPTSTTADATPAQGPKLDPSGTAQADSAKSKNKIVIGVLAAILAVIVFFGRRARNKRRKAQ